MSFQEQTLNHCFVIANLIHQKQVLQSVHSGHQHTHMEKGIVVKLLLWYQRRKVVEVSKTVLLENAGLKLKIFWLDIMDCVLGSVKLSNLSEQTWWHNLRKTTEQVENGVFFGQFQYKLFEENSEP